MSELGLDISSILLKELFLPDCTPFSSKEELFEYMSGRFEETGIVLDRKAFKQALEKRESLGPTYMGDFIAIPHGQCTEVLKPGVGFIRCSDSFNYDSAGDSGPVKYVFVLAVSSSQEGNQHLKILATLAGYLMRDDFRDLMEHAGSYEEFMEGISRIESSEEE